jgi:cytochrome c oxidase cbb3-type subunit 1
MDPFVRRFIRSSLAWLAFGVLLGCAMAIWPYRMLPYRPAHVHANLLGFVSMMIFGVAYHVIPRFTGRGLHSPRLAAAQLLVSNAGLFLMVCGFMTRVTWATAGSIMLGVGGVTSAVGALIFVFNLWRTLEPARTGLGTLGSSPRKEVR